MQPLSPLEALSRSVERFRHAAHLTMAAGVVAAVSPSYVRVAGLSKFVRLGECVRIHNAETQSIAQVVRIDDDGAIIKSFDNNAGAGLGALVERLGPIEIAPHASWIGRVLNAFGEPVDGKPPVTRGERAYPVDAPPPGAMQRQRLHKPIRSGVRAVDCFTPLCQGQRIGVFAGSGVGKSTLLSMMTRSEGFDLAVVCLVGERGREVKEFLDVMASARTAATIAIVATGDESPMMRRLAPLTATAVAEAFRDQGASAILVVDSITRYAHASREVALAAGEPPVANGYTPGVLADLPRLLERAGPGAENSGSITGVYSVLLDRDDHNDPIADCIRATLDGHLVLDRQIAEQGRYPAINVLKSISRLADRVWSARERELAMSLRSLIFRYEETRDLRMLGGYQSGADAELDRAVTITPRIYQALRQSPDDPASVAAFREIAAAVGEELSAGEGARPGASFA